MKAPSALNVDHSWFKQLFELSPDPTWIIEDNRFVECNEAAIRALGYVSREELLNVHPSKLSPPRQPDGEDSYVKAERMMTLAKDKGLHRFEWMHTKADGMNFVAEVTLSAIVLRDRQVIYCVWRDISERKQAEEELRRFRVAMDATADGIYVVDRESMRFVDVNAGACNMLGLTREEILALGPEGVLSMSREDLAHLYDSVIASGGVTTTAEILRTRKDGKQAWVEIQRRAQRSSEGWMIVTVARDVTERKHAEEALRDSAEKLRVFADNVPAMTASIDKNLRLNFVNKRYADFFGYDGTDILGKHLREIVGESVYSEIEGHLVHALQGNSVTYQRTRKLPNGEPGYLEVKLLPHIGAQGETLGCFAVTTDITEHKLTEVRIQRMAHHDSLTGLPNRLLFNDRLEQAMSLAKRDSRQFALLYLDLDKFKPVNDTLGHTSGDELLKSAAARIRHQVRESDTVARVGGDEFTVILPDITGREEAEFVARKIIAALAEPFQLGSQKQRVDIGTSIGIALYPADVRDAADLVKVADAAMYSAKRAGSGYRFCAT